MKRTSVSPQTYPSLRKGKTRNESGSREVENQEIDEERQRLERQSTLWGFCSGGCNGRALGGVHGGGAGAILGLVLVATLGHGCARALLLVLGFPRALWSARLCLSPPPARQGRKLYLAIATKESGPSEAW